MATSRAAARSNSPLLAYVLHRYDWSETSLIVELFTRAQGRVVVAAKGAKRPTSQLRPVLLPFQPLHALLGRTPADEHGEVHTLRSAEWAGGAPLLGAAAMFSGFYLNELLLKLLPRQDAHPVLFDAYADTLAALTTGDDEAATLRAFELMLLRALGWLPELNVATLTAEPVAAAAGYTLHPEAGLTAQAGNGIGNGINKGINNDPNNGPNNGIGGGINNGITGAAWVALEAALAHGSMAALRAACAPAAAALRGPLRALLHYHLGHSTLRTRQVWQGVQRLAEQHR